MAEKNPGDVLTCDWNPFVGCERYSPGCDNCWFLDGIYPWQQRLGNIPVGAQASEPHFFEERLAEKALMAKNGIVGICQHGDLFWDRVTDEQIHRVLDVIDAVAPQKIAQRIKARRPPPKYMLWTKRVERMARLLIERYPDEEYGHRVPDWYGLGASLENQARVNSRLPHLLQVNGFRIAVLEPILGPIDLGAFIDRLDWVIVGSETGEGCRPAAADWFRQVRDVTKQAGKPFFIKQLGTSHQDPERVLDGRTWDEFPDRYVKQVSGVRRA